MNSRIKQTLKESKKTIQSIIEKKGLNPEQKKLSKLRLFDK